jgi:hypothetical protein
LGVVETMTPLAAHRLIALLDAEQDDRPSFYVPELPPDLAALAREGGIPNHDQTLALLGSPGLRAAMRIALRNRRATDWSPAMETGNLVLEPVRLAAATGDLDRLPWEQVLRMGEGKAAPEAGRVKVTNAGSDTQLFVTLTLEENAWPGGVEGIHLRLVDLGASREGGEPEPPMIWLEGITNVQGSVSGIWTPPYPTMRPWSRLSKKSGRRLHLHLL